MSRVFVKGNNFMRQLGMQQKLKQTEWTDLDLSSKLRNAESIIKKVEANQGQTCLLTDDGSMLII